MVVRQLFNLVVHPVIGRARLLFFHLLSTPGELNTIDIRELTRNHCLLILLMPLTVLSILPLLFASFVGISPELLVRTSIYNALLSSGDLIFVCIVYAQIPSTAIVRKKGWKIYWRKQ